MRRAKKTRFDSCSSVSNGAGSCYYCLRVPILMVGCSFLAPQIRFDAGVLVAHECPVKMLVVLAGGIAED